MNRAVVIPGIVVTTWLCGPLGCARDDGLAGGHDVVVSSTTSGGGAGGTAAAGGGGAAAAGGAAAQGGGAAASGGGASAASGGAGGATAGAGGASSSDGGASAAGAGGALSGGAGGAAGGDAAAGGAGGGAPVVYYACSGADDPAVGPFVPWFDEITGATGIDAVGTGLAQTSVGNGIAVADVDGDGLDDVAVTTGPTGPTLLYKNQGNLAFTDVTALAGVTFLQGYGVAFADLDDDGDQDLVVTGQGAVAVYENLGGMHFADDTPGSGLTSAIGGVNSAVIGDLDGDGLLDLYFFDSEGNRMFKNDGGFHFEDVTAAYGLAFMGGPKVWTGAMWDFDGDGLLDVHVGRDTGIDDADLGIPPPDWVGDKLFRNTGVHAGALQFTEVAKPRGMGLPRSSMGDIVADFDGDGRLDLYISNIGKDPLFLSQPDGTFVEAADALGAGATRRLNAACPADSTSRDCLLTTWGTALFDADHDGLDDLLAVNGKTGGFNAAQPSVVLRGKPGGGFDPVESALGCQNARALVAADLDEDGDLDVLTSTIAGPIRVFRNDAPAGAGWLRVRLVGTTSNRDGMGAVVTATLAGGRKIMRAVGYGGILFSSAPTEAHFTTGGQAIASLDVIWPSGTVQHVAPVALNQRLTLVEP